MVLGDGIRRNISTIPEEEQIRFRDAILKLHTDKSYPDGVSHWFKQDQIHQATHVHGGPAFLPWHRYLINEFEKLLRKVAPELSLHYWDFKENPEDIKLLGPNGIMGDSHGLLKTPWHIIHNKGVLEGSRDKTQNPADPPQSVSLNLNMFFQMPQDEAIVEVGDDDEEVNQWFLFRGELEGWHGTAHSALGGNIGSAHQAFEHPMVFLLHSNIDRLWAKWQLKPGKDWRLDPERIYGFESTHPEITENMEPWAGGTSHPEQKMRPWGSDFPAEMVTSKDPSIVTNVPKYDK
jgi:Common central domain of tyrosinase